MKLIDKSKVVAEIKRLRERAMDLYGYSQFDIAYENVLKVIDSFEVKEVNLKKEIDKWIDDTAITHEDCSISDVISTAKHFFELGLKAQKGGEE